MKSFLLVLILGLSSLAFADTREAFLSQESFDGSTFSFSYTAYDLKGDSVVASPEFSCNYYWYNGQKLVRSVDVKIMITGDFSQPDHNVQKSGSADVKSMIRSCVTGDAKVSQTMKFPVEVHLPAATTSSLVE